MLQRFAFLHMMWSKSDAKLRERALAGRWYPTTFPFRPFEVSHAISPTIKEDARNLGVLAARC
jgi:hypothetical protein